MSEERPAFFSTFEDAWDAFQAGGRIVALDAQRDQFLQGRAQFLALQVPVKDEMLQAASAAQEQLAALSGLSLMPGELLHISVRGIGFQVIAKSRPNDVLRGEVAGIGEAIATALSGVAQMDVEIGPVNVFPDALILEVRPVEPLRDVLRGLEQKLAVEDAFPYGVERYLPHITIANFMDPSVSSTLRTELPAMRALPPARATIRRLDFVRWWFTGHDVTAWPEVDVIRSYRLP